LREVFARHIHNQTSLKQQPKPVWMVYADSFTMANGKPTVTEYGGHALKGNRPARREQKLLLQQKEKVEATVTKEGKLEPGSDEFGREVNRQVVEWIREREKQLQCVAERKETKKQTRASRLRREWSVRQTQKDRPEGGAGVPRTSSKGRVKAEPKDGASVVRMSAKDRIKSLSNTILRDRKKRERKKGELMARDERPEGFISGAAKKRKSGEHDKKLRLAAEGSLPRPSRDTGLGDSRVDVASNAEKKQKKRSHLEDTGEPSKKRAKTKAEGEEQS
jgi:hypothetical protein